MIEFYKKEFLDYVSNKVKLNEPKGLYEPIDYILQIGGKKIRPILVLLAADLFGGNYKNALDAALAVEIFHNFTLIHDDIMDDAPLRRGKQTVHEKWDLSTGILSGDAMLILAYQCLESYDSNSYKKINSLFSKTAIEVCEGQQLDVDFESLNDVFNELNKYPELRWIVMRNFEGMPNKINIDKHLDVDLLVNDYYLIKRILDGTSATDNRYDDGKNRILNNK